VEALTHDASTRKNIPTAEYESAHRKGDAPLAVPYARRNQDLDPQLVWRGKDEQDWSDLVVPAPPLFIQEKVHPKALIDDLARHANARKDEADELVPDLFADFNGIPQGVDKTEFYQHDQHWSNRMILGDSLQVMASLAEREGLRGQVQCIYFDPPYGIKFNSNFQWSTTSRDVKDGNAAHITREPEVVKAFRDTWRDGIHSYLTYLRDRLTVARELLHESGSIFVQIGDENVHTVRALLDEVFGNESFCAQITIEKTSSQTQDYLPSVTDYVVWYARNRSQLKFRVPLDLKELGGAGTSEYNRVRSGDLRRRVLARSDATVSLQQGELRYRQDNLTSQSVGRDKGEGAASWFVVEHEGQRFTPSATNRWKTNKMGMARLTRAARIEARGSSLSYVRFLGDFPALEVNNVWSDVKFSSRSEDKLYVVQSAARLVQRCVLMTSDPGDLVLDPTCGSGTTAYVAEQWGRRWITIDTSRVALALARARLMGARYPYYLLADSREGQKKEAEVTRTVPADTPVRGDVRHGFVYERVPHVTLKSIANNAEIDVIWEKWQGTLEPLRTTLNAALGQSWEEWQIPRDPAVHWSSEAQDAHRAWWDARIARQREIDASIAAKAEVELLFDRPYEDRKKVRVAGPFTVESLSPHRTITPDEVGPPAAPHGGLRGAAEPYAAGRDFTTIILDNLRVAGLQQVEKSSHLHFTALTPWPGALVCAEGRYVEGSRERRAAVFVGPEFGTVSRADLAAAAREAVEAGFDVLVACAFNFEPHTTEFDKLGKLPVLKARMNADLHMADELRKTDTANLFVVFGEPDVELLHDADGRFRVTVKGVDVFDPTTGEIRTDDPDGIACWFVDTDYDEESFFVRHAYFLGANDPYKALRTTLKAEIDAAAWETLYGATSRPFERPRSGRVAVKVINHLGDEVMKVLRV
jgi:adenine-specific DNA-methyltransferase